MAEQRSTDRQRTYKAARIGLGGSRATTGCLVRNLSPSGACLQLDDVAELPDRFNLVFDSGEPSRMCNVVWRGRRQLGVKFG